MSDVPTTPSGEQSAAPVSSAVAREAAAFENHVTQNHVAIPENFKSVGDWFNSLKSAQGEYTKARQEIATLRQQAAPVAAPVVPAQEQPVGESIPSIPEELRIPEAPKAPPVDETKATKEQLTQEEWTKYSTEFAVSNSLSETTLAEIKAKTNLPDFVIQDFLQGQKARLQQAYAEAATRVGGKDTLAKVFDWASKNLSTAEQANVNASLASPSWEMTLLGLKAKYEQAASKLTSNEPAKTGAKAVAAVQAVTTNNMPYDSKGEFLSERNDPRFSRDPKFRAAVENRMARTNFNTL